ncbi:MAG: ACT domain-containing protein [Candidatus Micrarchaeia archaeon]
MRQITVLVENRVGALADVTEALGASGVNIKSISAQGSGNEGVIRLITEDERTAVNALEKAGFRVSVGDVMTIKLRHRPGELAKIARKLARAGVNIECIYQLSSDRESAELVLKPDSIENATRALRA